MSPKLVNQIIIIGFGNIAQASLPLIRATWKNSTIVAFEKFINPSHGKVADTYEVELRANCINEQNYESLLAPLLRHDTLLLNLATEVCSADLIRLAQARGAFYLDTCIDPWTYEHEKSGDLVTNYQLREELRELALQTRGLPTAIVAHGANPGFVSILVKEALEIMRDRYLPTHRAVPSSRHDWATLARDLGVRVIQISERDAQASTHDRKAGEFVSTWSVDGLVTECLQPAELGWGSHEQVLPFKAVTHKYGSRAAIYIDQPSCSVRVKSWSPNCLDFWAYLITHNEAISIADYLSLTKNGCLDYRPTCYYAYRPCDEAVESMKLLDDGSRYNVKSTRVIKEEIAAGIDELGVFLISEKFPALWLGSNLSIEKARKMAPHNNATSLQVVASVIAGIKWIEENPAEGLVESEELDHDFIYSVAAPYWSPIVSEFVDWRPSDAAPSLQFVDFLVRGVAA